MCNDSILVSLDSDSAQMESGLYKPETAHEHIFRTAEVLGVGPGKWSDDGTTRVRVPLEPGDGVIFIKFMADKTKNAMGVQRVVGKDKAILKPEDILLVYDRKNPPSINQ